MNTTSFADGSVRYVIHVEQQLPNVPVVLENDKSSNRAVMSSTDAFRTSRRFLKVWTPEFGHLFGIYEHWNRRNGFLLVLSAKSYTFLNPFFHHSTKLSEYTRITKLYNWMFLVDTIGLKKYMKYSYSSNKMDFSRFILMTIGRCSCSADRRTTMLNNRTDAWSFYYKNLWKWKFASKCLWHGENV